MSQASLRKHSRIQLKLSELLSQDLQRFASTEPFELRKTKFQHMLAQRGKSIAHLGNIWEYNHHDVGAFLAIQAAVFCYLYQSSILLYFCLLHQKSPARAAEVEKGRHLCVGVSRQSHSAGAPSCDSSVTRAWHVERHPNSYHCRIHFVFVCYYYFTS